MVIEPIFEKEFISSSYGFRPKRSCKDALREVDGLIKEGYNWVVDADIASYFDSIPHSTMIERVEERISDGRIIDLLRIFVENDIIENTNKWTPTRGTPQGAVISPLLANIYLHPLDKLLSEQNIKIVRFADDFVVLCKSQQEALAALTLVSEWVENNGLTLHPDKTSLGNCSQRGQGFEFLGYLFENGKRFVRKKSVNALRDKIRQYTRRTNNKSVSNIIKTLNPVLLGWFNYFKHARPWIYKAIDGFVRRRLRSILRKYQKKRHGTGRCYADHKKWNNNFFTNHGLFTMHEARLDLVSQSR